nr:coenzyme F420-0:L-glutamate ligase [Gammaproteobacteria bacterium]
MTDPADLSLYRLPGLPLVATGDDLAAIIAAGVDDAGLQMLPGDIVVLAQKIVSKAEGRIVDLGTVKPSAEARQLAAETDKDPRAVELILRESTAVIR